MIATDGNPTIAHRGVLDRAAVRRPNRRPLTREHVERCRIGGGVDAEYSAPRTKRNDERAGS